MSVWTIRRRKLWSLAPVFVAVLLLIASGASAEQYPQSTLHPKGDFARMVDGVFTTTVKWAAVVFVLVEGALIWTIIRFRGKPTDPEPKQVHGHTMAEIIWTAIPAVILAFIAVPTIQTIFKTYERPAGNALEVEVIGHQWWWEFHYPQFGVTTANELHVPVGRPVVLKMTTKDVLHSFWLPQIAAKRDVFPNRNTMLWFTAEEAGNYSGQCAEFCGIQHGKMGFRVVASPPDEFDTYIKEMLATGAPKPVADSAKATAAAGLEVATLAATTAAAAQRPAAAADSAAPTDSAAPAVDPLVAEGQKLFTAKGCAGCHTFDATKPMGVGPNLAKIGSRAYIAAGMLKNTDENLIHWIQMPQSVKQGVLMPNLGLTDAEAKALAAYLRTHK